MRPAPLLIALIAGWGLAGLAVPFLGWPLWQWQLAGGAMLMIAALDAWRLRSRPTPDVVREVPEALPLGIERDVALCFETHVRQRLEVFDLHPGGWTSSGLPRRLSLAPVSATRFTYRLRPTARGDARFDGVQLRLRSTLALWRQSRVAGVPQRVRVYPNFAPLARFALFSAEQASRLVGAHLKRRRGEGTDFHQMREYRIGDSLRQIDWKATARSRKLISREYQDE